MTNFLFLGKLSINFIIRMIWVVQYGGQLEGQLYQFEPADFLFMLIFNGGLLLLASIFLGKLQLLAFSALSYQAGVVQLV